MRPIGRQSDVLLAFSLPHPSAAFSSRPGKRRIVVARRAWGPADGDFLCHDYGMITTRPKATTLAGRPNQPLPMSGRPTSGRVVKIHAGQSHGYIRSADNRDVFFHRADTTWGTFNNLAIGDEVAFELIEDRVSGPRATRVRTLA
jgi:cold shock CspA family protein